MLNNNQVSLPFLVQSVYFAFMLFAYTLLIYTLVFPPVCIASVDAHFTLFKDYSFIPK